MAIEEEQKQSIPEKPENGEKDESLFSPGFRSVVAMAGWDEEALLIASLVVEDTPDRNSKSKKRFKTPPMSSRRKRRSQRKSPTSIAVPIIDLDEAAPKLTQEPEQKIEVKAKEEKKVEEEVQEIKKPEQEASGSCSSSSSSLPCMDRLREELSCAICLDICFEPSTTPCGHSFCKKCLRSAADKCGKKCPKCRQLISNGRSCTVNTVLWNTIQLLFPKEVEARKELTKSKSPRVKTPARRSYYNARNRTIAALNSPENDGEDFRIQRISRRGNARMTRQVASQDEDAALALRLQREEFMVAFRSNDNDESQQPHQQDRRSNSLNSARANLRAMASRAINIRLRNRRT